MLWSSGSSPFTWMSWLSLHLALVMEAKRHWVRSAGSKDRFLLFKPTTSGDRGTHYATWGPLSRRIVGATVSTRGFLACVLWSHVFLRVCEEHINLAYLIENFTICSKTITPFAAREYCASDKSTAHGLAISTTPLILSALALNHIRLISTSCFFFAPFLALISLASIPASIALCNSSLQTSPICLSNNLSRVSTHILTLALSEMLPVFAA